MNSITNMIYSNEYADYILPYSNDIITSTYADYGAQLLDSHYFLIHDNRSAPTFPLKNTYDLFDEYLFMPKLFLRLSTVSLEEAGIIKAQTQPLLQLNGRGTIIGFIDSGIDYTHKAFRTSSGSSRILSLWDQTIYPSTSSASLNPFYYGTIYSQEEINTALSSQNPYSIVPSIDETGHGTALAGIAAGTPSPENDFIGAAFEADLCVVKLKQAKPYLRDYLFADKQAVLYQENDIMMAIQFLINFAEKQNKPLIICLGLGTNQGDHAGNSPLSKMITNCAYDTYTIFSIASGNEGNKAHHYYHTFENPSYEQPNSSFSPSLNYNDAFYSMNSSVQEEIEITVPASCTGFTAELWGSTNALLSIGFQSPLGTQIAPISAAPGRNETISFVLEKTKIQMVYSIVPESGGDQLVFFRFIDPVEGNWTIRVFNRTNSSASFHVWLPALGVLQSDVTFLKPNPETTLTIPSDAWNSITTGFYNAYNNGTVAETGRGFTRNRMIKPNIISPGINVTAPVPNAPSAPNRFQAFSGSSAAAALLSGGIAQLQQWRIESEFPNIINTASMNAYITRGAIREIQQNYPNPISGYGKLNIYNVFSSLMA